MKDWTFKDNIDHIFDVIKKTADVIKSCKSAVHLEGASNYVKNVKHYLTFFDKSTRQQEFCDKQMSEFDKMIRIKRKEYLVD